MRSQILIFSNPQKHKKKQKECRQKEMSIVKALLDKFMLLTHIN